MSKMDNDRGEWLLVIGCRAAADSKRSLCPVIALLDRVEPVEDPSLAGVFFPCL